MFTASWLRRWQARREIILLSLILLLGAFFRLYQLQNIPAGLSTDEATAGVNAEAVLDGDRRLFYPPYDEPLFVYVSALGVAIFGPTLLALHLPAALFGIATIYALYLLVREMFDSSTAVLAAIALAISYWAIHESRLGFRAITLPCIELFAFYFLWRALKRNQLRDYFIAGALLGLTLYTYSSSRIVPVIVFLFIALAFIFRTRWQLWHSRGLALYALAAILVSLPLGIYFWLNPNGFFGRFQTASSVSLNPSEFQFTLDSIVRTLGMFSFAGDTQWKYNLAGQPVFDPIWAILFYLGLALALVRIRKPEYFFLLLWFVVGLAPGALTGEAPHFLRTMASQPAAFVFPALTLAALLTFIPRQFPRALPFAVALLLALFAFTATETFDEYFHHWANDKNVAQLFYPETVSVAAFLHTLPTQQPVYLSAQYFDLQTIMLNYFTWRQSVPRPHLFDASRGLVFNASNAHAIYIIPLTAPANPNVNALLTRGALVSQAQSNNGTTLYRAYTLETTSAPQPTISLDARFGDIAQLVGYEVNANPRAGEPLTVTTYTRVLNRVDVEGEYKFFVHLRDATGYVWSQDEGIGGDPAQWNPGETVLTTFTLPIPPDAMPKNYQLEIGMYSLTRGRISVVNAQGQVIGTAIDSPPLSIAPGAGTNALTNPNAQRVKNLNVGDGISIAAFESDARVDPGAQLRVTLYWKATAAIMRDDSFQLSLLDASGNIAAHTDIHPSDGFFPTSQWGLSKILRESYLFPIPSEVQPGDYVLAINLLDDVTSQPQPPAHPLTSVQVTNLAHLYAPPPIQHPISAQLDDVILFIGYDLPNARVKPSDQLPLTLYWRDIQPMPTDYTVFVHVIDQNNRVWGQRDRAPVNGARPTSTWIANEILQDSYRVPISADAPPGEYSIEIGMYDSKTLQRLPIVDANGQRLDGDRLLLDKIIIAH